ncbi:MAG TPA: hypothetical protein PKA63_02040 [Oligoflexia bacterium]|nr:hypothetical protein [Oligoflexia bacterium]HMP47431.1 hypothetical protein [Oligoflexia bacterium]
MFILLLLFTAVVPVELAEAQGTPPILKPIRVEGKVFHAQTLLPLNGVDVQLWSFTNDAMPTSFGRSVVTQEGGHYSFEFQPAEVDDESNDRSVGYAFAIVCYYQNTTTRKVYIMPLYTSLERGVVYSRDAYIQLPRNVTSCIPI